MGSLTDGLLAFAPTRRRLLASGAALAAGAALEYTLSHTSLAAAVTARRQRCLEVARNITGTDDHGQDLRALYRRLLNGPGPKSVRTGKHVVVVGAGMAGLAAGWMLHRAGHRVTIAEANVRVGGRIKTVRSGWAGPGHYGEAGAMRIPAQHRLALGLIRRLGLPLQSFELANSHRLIRAGGATVFQDAYGHDPAVINKVFGVRQPLTARALLETAFAPIRNTATSADGWARFLDTYDEWSLRRWLIEGQMWGENTTELVGALQGISARMPMSVMHSYLTAQALAAGASLYQIEGGMDQLPLALARQAPPVRHGLRLTAVDTRPHKVRLTFDSASDGEVTMDADHAVITAPFSCLRYVDFNPALSYGKQQAVELLHYGAGSKQMLEFNQRWWEDHDAGVGGQDVTDTPLRTVVYPSHPLGVDGGVVIASYTWADDAELWDSLSEHERAARALDLLTDLHGPVVGRTYTGRYASASWMDNPFSCGEAAIYAPGQAVALGPDTRTIEADGRLVFAGCSTSAPYRAWIEGALESACRAVMQLGLHPA
ncbi:flavin monoamine oxidase family protein [Streptoverticillium reticulum]|uniref:flavin monoamine oxidase family protein n=1 Tax=Streptoverticillium reticulum TaxID=1433415 RepID=UPI0039BFBAB7